MTHEYRQDFVEIPSNPKVDDNGYIRTEGIIARIGVQEYQQNGETIREFRPPEEVKKSAESFQRQPITLNHPPMLVNAENAANYSKGLSGEVDYENGLLEAELTITHKDAVEAATTSHKQLSNGYLCEVEDSSGTWTDEEGLVGEKGKQYQYDRIQKNIKGNHIALVKRARAGDVASLKLDEMNTASAVRLDEADSFENVDNNCSGNQYKEESMKDLKINNSNYQVEDAVYDSYMKMHEDMKKAHADIEDMKSKMAEMQEAQKQDSKAYEMYENMLAKVDSKNQEIEQLKADSKEQKSQLDEATANLDTVKAQLNKANEELNQRLDSKQFEEQFKARYDAFKEAEELLPQGTEFNPTMTDTEIFKSALANSGLSEKVDSWSDEQIRSSFATLKETQDLFRNDSQRKVDELYTATQEAQNQKPEGTEDRMDEALKAQSEAYAEEFNWLNN